MEIHNINIKTVLEGEEENLFVYRDDLLIQERHLTDEEIYILEDIVERYKYNKIRESVKYSEICRRFVLNSNVDAKEVSDILMDKNINSTIEDNRLLVYGIRNCKIADVHIAEYKSRKDALSK
ncbi:hypothetical protein P4679_24870 [Priestia megaterium]|uniref:hypothetical protein n=1 Tax=Priestia megaterium TaxID=1404 RepID=UPI002E1B09D5|nr:hypothetical protein [Priestia megaterium]